MWRAEREDERAEWEALEALLSRVAAKGEKALSFDDAEALARLYRRSAARLADARARGWDERRTAYLESLVRRAHFVVYAPPRRRLGGLLLEGGFARAFRDAWRLVAIGFALFLAGAVSGGLATAAQPELAYALIGAMYPAEMVQSLLDSGEARADLLLSGQGSGLALRSAFAAGLLLNNTRVALLAFATGIAWAFPTAVLQTMNGAVLGSLAAIFAPEGARFWAWALPHAIPEVLALSIASAGGLQMGFALIDPRGRPRREALAEAGRSSAVLLGLALLLLLYAALVEGFFRQSSAGTTARLILAAVNGAVLFAYLGLAGSRRRGA